MSKLNIVFCGSPDFAAISLKYLLEQSCRISAVVTMPDKKQGRGQKLKFNPVKNFALEHNLPVLQPEKATNPDFLNTLESIKPDLVIVTAYGKILRRQFIDIPKYCCVNLHASLLPRYRGPSPIHFALLNGDKFTGVSTFVIDEGMDTGEIILDKQIAIDPDDNLGTLHDKLAVKGAKLLYDTVLLFENGMPQTHPQPETGVVYTEKITHEMTVIDWSMPAEKIHNIVRAFDPHPGAITEITLHSKTKLLKIFGSEISVENHQSPAGQIIEVTGDYFKIACGANALIIKKVQLEGKKLLSSREFMIGYPLQKGITLGN